MFNTREEKRAYRIGLIAANRNKRKVSSNLKPKYLGSVYVNGKFYDTNFKNPHQLDSSFIKKLHMEYDPDGNMTDLDVVNRYVMHMRREYGRYDKNGNFIGMLGD